MVSFCEAAIEQIPSFCGIKYSCQDLAEGCILINLNKDGQKIKAYYGCDQVLPLINNTVNSELWKTPTPCWITPK